jgi:hypothetical protein
MVDHYRPMNPTKPISRRQLPRSNDTRLLIAGVVAFLALVAYLGVAYARARSSPAVAAAVRNLAKPQKIGPWTARSSNLARVRRTTRGALAIRVVPQSAGLYGIEIKELALGPALRRGFALSVGLRARRPSRLLVQINHGSASPLGYLVNTTGDGIASLFEAASRMEETDSASLLVRRRQRLRGGGSRSAAYPSAPAGVDRGSNTLR